MAPPEYAYTRAIWPMLAAASTLGVLTVFAWRRRSFPGALALCVMAAAALLWATGSILEITSLHIADKIFWHKFQRIWQLPTVTASLWFALDYANLNRWLTRRMFVLLALPACALLLLILTDDTHHWLWLQFSFDRELQPVMGVVSWAFIEYGLMLTVVTWLVFVWLFLRSPLHRWPAALCLLAHAAARTTYMLDLAHVNPMAPADPTVVTVSFGALMYGVALFHFGMFDLMPVAHGTVVEQMHEGMLVVDAHGRIVDLNPAAATILGLAVESARGARLEAICPALVRDAAVSGKGPPHDDISIPTRDAVRHYAVEWSPLRRGRQVSAGSVVLLHDVTSEKRASARILDQQRALATLRERDRVARELHDDLGQTLGFVKLQAQAAGKLLARNELAEAGRCLDRLAAAAQDAHVDVREYIAGARSSVAATDSFLPSLERCLRRFEETSAINTTLTVTSALGPHVFEPMVGAQLLRIVQEALTNARKHGAPRQVDVRVEVTDGRAEVVVQDDGTGFDAASLKSSGGRGFGLGFMRERAEEIGGHVLLRTAPRQGTQVVIQVPVGDAS